MPRRAHKKSRNGCLECKRRHIKCNENRPICSNCTVSERVCEYGINVFKVTRPVDWSYQSTASASLSPVTNLPSGRSSLSPNPGAPQDAPVNMLHMELFHHLYTETFPELDRRKYADHFHSIMPHLLKAPYVVNELLAFSALHLSTKHPERQGYYRTHAAQLQTHALAIFKETTLEVNQETCVPLFFFSAILGLHTLCDVLVYRDNDFDQFVDKFVHCFRIQRGVRAICGKAWGLLHQSVVKPLLADGQSLYHFDGRLGAGCEKLLRLVQAANLGATLTDIYKQAIEHLQTSTNALIAAGILAGSNHGNTAWPVLVPPEYIDLLLQRRPEALVILAHYAILLHSCRDSWMFGDGGRFLIESIRDFLGPDWTEWLEWPIKALDSPIEPLLQEFR
ncbi:hypothetical protein LV164_002225 [Aspergillus fumigatus]|nr:hypothetical protein KXX42_002200 [Aspergillus fumigatus]KAH1552055.1 hypothetical protein KXX57_008036 [Aspergillus fumigatus]KAH1983533.1 hypothetical protein KXW88_003192 [Aspergillus fumigatus]KAH2309513.1 hypothetical protein KXV47_005773 [Aspergillus fumigatus]KAH2660011.1 hypothetical protein KXV32_001299 [Aspergillus fumigatus]